MKIFNVILSSIMVLVLMISSSGEVFNVHYCFSSKTYSLDLDLLTTSKNSLNHPLCNCGSSEEVGCESSENESCCKNIKSENEGVSCCVDIQAISKSDRQYNFQVFKHQFQAFSVTIFNSSEPDFFYSYNSKTFDFNKTRDHSPPEIVTSQILLI